MKDTPDKEKTDILIERMRDNVKYALMEFWSQYQGDNDAESRDRTIEKAVNDLCSIVSSIKQSAYEEGYKAGEKDNIAPGAVIRSIDEHRKEAVSSYKKELAEKIDKCRSWPDEMFQLYKGKMPFVVFKGEADEEEKFQIFKLGYNDALSKALSLILINPLPSKEE